MARACRFQFHLGPFRTIFLALLLIACASATARAGTKAEHLHLLAAAPAAYSGKISGTVLDEMSHPVAYATVSAEFMGVGVLGMAVPQAETDAKGRFVIHHVPWGTYIVFADKPGAGYPSGIVFSCFYGRDRVPEVTLSPQAPAATVVVRIGPKAGILSGTITSAHAGKPITRALYVLRRPGRAGAATADRYIPSHFTLLIPSEMVIALTVSAPGFEPWRRTVKMTPGERKVLLIRLRPLATEPGTPPSQAAPAQKGVFHLKVRQRASQSLTLIKPTDPDFENTLDAYFPGLSLEGDYQQAIKPFLVIVRNDNYLPAAAYAITWTAHYEDGAVESFRNMFVNRPLMLRLVTSYIPPEGLRLISPLFNVTPKQYASHPNFTQMYPAEMYPSSKELASVDPKVDGVVYTDGTFIGPDKTDILERYVVAQFAVRDEALSALDLIKSYFAPQLIVAQKLQETLHQQIQFGNKVSKRTLLARYVRARDRTAQDVQRILRNRGLGGLDSILQKIINQSGENVSPSRFGNVYPKLSDKDPRVFGGTPRSFLWGLSWTAAQQ